MLVDALKPRIQLLAFATDPIDMDIIASMLTAVSKYCYLLNSHRDACQRHGGYPQPRPQTYGISIHNYLTRFGLLRLRLTRSTFL